MCPDLKAIKIETEGYVDLYYNDMYALNITLKAIGQIKPKLFPIVPMDS